VIGTGPRAAGIDTLRLQIFFFHFFQKKNSIFSTFLAVLKLILLVNLLLPLVINQESNLQPKLWAP
jgi:hypothetical protein